MTTRNISLIVVLLLAPFGIIYWMNFCSSRVLDKDYSTVEPAIMFHEVMGVDVPKGMNEVKITGHHGYGTGVTWMKLHGSDKALQDLVASAEPVYKNKYTFTMPEGKFGVDKIYKADAIAAGWDEVPTLNKPRIYIFRNHLADEHWLGTMVVSGKTHTAYITAQIEK